MTGRAATRPTLSVTNATVTEGTNTHAEFTVSLSNPATIDVFFNLTLTNGTATGGGTDFGAADATNLQVSTDNGLTWNNATTATIAAGTTFVKVRTPITDDALDEAVENFTLTVQRTGGPIMPPESAVGIGTINDNDATPSLAIDDVTVNEDAGTMTFTVTLSAASGLPVTVDFATSPGTATAPADFTSTNGTLSFAPGVTSQTFTVSILDDTIFEQSESFTVTLSNAVERDDLRRDGERNDSRRRHRWRRDRQRHADAERGGCVGDRRHKHARGFRGEPVEYFDDGRDRGAGPGRWLRARWRCGLRHRGRGQSPGVHR